MPFVSGPARTRLWRACRRPPWPRSPWGTRPGGPDRAGGASGVVFPVLRVATGSLTCAPAAIVPVGKTVGRDPLLREAQARLVEWQLIEAVGPSMAAPVDLAEELPSPKTTVTAAQWRVLRAIGGGGTVDDVARALDIDEFHACQAVKRLVDAGLVVVGDGASERDDQDELEDEDETTDAQAAP